MKKNSGKKSDRVKSTRTQPTVRQRSHPEGKSSPKKSFSEPAASATPFAPAAASPLSKESTAESSATVRSIPEPVTSAPKPVSSDSRKAPTKKKAGKRPPRAGNDARPKVKVPALLLEGDLPPSQPVSGPGARYALAPQPVAAPHVPHSAELPEAYGTGRVFVAARDPHWLYVSWDFTREQQSKLNSESCDGHLVLRFFQAKESAQVVPEIAVHPESKNWFVHVPYAETAYRAEIGLYKARDSWKSVATSQYTFTPPDAPSKDVTAKFATIPVEISFQQVVEVVQQFVAVSDQEPLLEAVALASEVQRGDIPNPSMPRIGQSSKKRGSYTAGRKQIPIQITPGSEWTPQQTQVLARLIHIDSLRRVWLGSMEITELVRRQLQEEIASIAAAEAKRAARGEKAVSLLPELHVSSPFGGELPKDRNFWFKINAELVVYGATEPDAYVAIAGRPIQLRPDGTFSFRFSLPDGRYQLPAVAVSGDGVEAREARLEFVRSTEYTGRVEAVAQDPSLKPPRTQT